jgi:hypothetical protein
VVKAYDYKTNQMLAIKIIRNKKRFHHQALVEAITSPDAAACHSLRSCHLSCS